MPQARCVGQGSAHSLLEPSIVMFDEFYRRAGSDLITAEIAKLIHRSPRTNGTSRPDRRSDDLHSARTIADRLIVLDRGQTAI